jgi:hypothetical protein
MIFIKNFTNEEPNDIRLELKKTEEATQVNLYINASEAIPLVESKIPEVYDSMNHAFDYIRDAKNFSMEREEEGSISKIVTLLDNKPTEVGFHVKGVKTVLKKVDEESTYDAEIIKYEEEDEGKRHYPRDVIAFLLDNTIDGAPVEEYQAVIDRRNLGAKTSILKTEKYTVILLYIKWPIWSKLKHPVYGYIKAVMEDGTINDTLPTAFKLGYSDNKITQRNQILFIDIKEAKDYLEESFRILRERKVERQSRENNRPNNRKNFRNNYNNDGGNRPYNKNGNFNNNKKYRNNKVYK